MDEALRLADQASIAWIVHNSQGGILDYGTTRRTASTTRTLALIACDKGCAFPGCTDPPERRRETPHHPLVERRTTTLDDLCLLCDHHHDRINTGSWTTHTTNSQPWFTPPPWTDPTQQPQRNTRP